MKDYIGHPAQVYGVEEVRLVGGKGDGMRLFQVRNAAGLAFTVNVDRAADITRLSVGGVNYGYFAPCGWVAPSFFDKHEFLASFTAGFFTTCGLRAVGSPCVDEGEETTLHGTLSGIPCENIYHFIENDEIHVVATVREASLFGSKLLLKREYVCPLYENEIRMTDRIENIGTTESPLQVLYHCNMGYPLLSPEAKLTIPYIGEIEARTAHAASGLSTATVIEEPQDGYEEMCFYYQMEGAPTVSLFNEKLGRGVEISYDTRELPFFTEWKMMGKGEYVLGLEPGNCLPEGRAAERAAGHLEFLAPNATKTHHLTFRFTEK